MAWAWFGGQAIGGKGMMMNAGNFVFSCPGDVVIGLHVDLGGVWWGSSISGKLYGL